MGAPNDAHVSILSKGMFPGAGLFPEVDQKDFDSGSAPRVDHSDYRMDI